jgi:hypothetical protein
MVPLPWRTARAHFPLPAVLGTDGGCLIRLLIPAVLPVFVYPALKAADCPL